MIEFNMGVPGTILMAVVILLVGRFLQSRISILSKFFIPAPVIGGFLFSVIFSGLHYFQVIDFVFDAFLQKMLMIAFFATVGFSASFKFLKIGGKTVCLFLVCAATLVILQNVLGVSLAWMLGQSGAFGMATASIPMTGGHGTAAAFGPLLENKFNLANGSSITIAAATFGLIAGSLLGGPIGRRLMAKHDLKPNEKLLKAAHVEIDLNEDKVLKISEHGMFNAITNIAFAIGVGSVISYWFDYYSWIMPEYIGAMFAAAFIRNLSDYSGWFMIKDNEVTVIGNMTLSLFLAMALMNMNLISLANLALPMLIILCGQVLMMGLFAYFITFRVMGKDYDAAVMAVGHCGFGLGATPNAMANMEAFTAKNYPSPQAFFVLPIVGSLFIDFINSGVITTFLNFI